jgi:ribose-phosphate pyrophosphokinase
MFEVVGDVKDRICVVVDDMIDTGGTIATAAETLLEFGAAQVIVAATHGILSAPASERLNSAAISEVIVTDTLPISEDKRFPKLTILSIAPLLAEAVRAVFSEDSVTKLVEDQPMLFDK